MRKVLGMIALVIFVSYLANEDGHASTTTDLRHDDASVVVSQSATTDRQ